MLRRFIYSLEKNSLISKSLRRFSQNKGPEESAAQKADKKSENINKNEENQDEYEDYGDVKIRRGGRKIKVDESETSDSKGSFIYFNKIRFFIC